MIKIDRKNYICELSDSSDEIFIDVQFALHKAVHNAVVKNGGDFATAAKVVCNALADSLVDTEKYIQNQLKKGQENSEIKQ